MHVHCSSSSTWRKHFRRAALTFLNLLIPYLQPKLFVQEFRLSFTLQNTYTARLDPIYHYSRLSRQKQTICLGRGALSNTFSFQPPLSLRITSATRFEQNSVNFSPTNDLREDTKIACPATATHCGLLEQKFRIHNLRRSYTRP